MVHSIVHSEEDQGTQGVCISPSDLSYQLCSLCSLKCPMSITIMITSLDENTVESTKRPVPSRTDIILSIPHAFSKPSPLLLMSTVSKEIKTLVEIHSCLHTNIFHGMLLLELGEF